MTTFEGSAPHADVVLRGAEQPLMDVFVNRERHLVEVLAVGEGSLVGGPEALACCRSIFHIMPIKLVFTQI